MPLLHCLHIGERDTASDSNGLFASIGEVPKRRLKMVKRSGVPTDATLAHRCGVRTWIPRRRGRRNFWGTDMATASPPAETKRARETAPGNSTSTERHLSQVVSFRLAKEEYGLDIMSVQEIILMGEITKIPEVPDYIRGLINLRGKVIPIIDLRKRFDLEACEATEHTRIIVVNAAGTTFGIVVDAVSQVLRIESNQIEPPPQGLVGLDQAYIKGLVKMELKIMILLNMEAVLSVDEQAKLAAQASVVSQ